MSKGLGFVEKRSQTPFPPASALRPEPNRDHEVLDPRRWLALCVILSAAFLGVLDFFVVNIAIPVIEGRLGATHAQVQLMIALYGQGYAVFLITGGRLGDIYGRKRMFTFGAAGFTLASTLCGLAPTPGFLIGARIIQGVSGALMFPQVLSLIQVMFPPHERHIAFGIFGAVLGTGSFAGNLLGGLLIQWDIFGWSWRPVFLINLPIGTIAVVASHWLLRESRAGKSVRLDIGGVALATVALLALIYPLIEGRDAGWPAWTFISMAASPLLTMVFLSYERRLMARGGFPLVDLGLFGDRVFVVGLGATLAIYSAMATFFLTFTIFLQKGLEYSPRETGLVFAPFAVGFFCSSTLAVRLNARLGSRIINLGLVLMMTGIAGMIAVTHFQSGGMSEWQMITLLTIYGTGQGCVTPSLLSAVLSGIPTRSAGSASGVLTTVQQVAQGLGIAAVGTIFFGLIGQEPQPASTYARAMATALACNGVLLATAFGLVLLLPRRTVHVEALEI
jgi:EmrB/QacA subfamily drug resistance transporter